MDATKDNFYDTDDPHTLKSAIRRLQTELKLVTEENEQLRSMIKSQRRVILEQQKDFSDMRDLLSRSLQDYGTVGSSAIHSDSDQGFLTDDDYEVGGLKMNLTPHGSEIITPKKKKFKGATVDFVPHRGKLELGFIFDEE